MTNSLEVLRQKLEGKLASLHFGDYPQELYEPIRYIMSLGGKRLRPLLTLLSYQLFKDDPERILEQAIAVEVFHNFTLVHDDIMDNAPLRRGMPTVHEKWNSNIGILSGDVMIVKVYDYLIQDNRVNLKRIISDFNQCAIEVCEGQQMDMNFESRLDVSESEYLRMIKLKTASLLGYSLELGALLANREVACEHLSQFGLNIGIGFQIKDDLLDVFGDDQKVGKQVGGDIIARKKTFMTIRAFAVANKADVNRMKKVYTPASTVSAEEAVKTITSIYKKYNIKEQAEAKMNEYFDIGFKHLRSVDGSLEGKALLRGFTESLIDRES